ncbi:MAG: thioredoxin family protein, partial [Candidatus Woesearchaeota archaeon]
KGDCPKCEQQGFILDYIKKKYNNTMIYAFDINNDNNALKTIKNKYKIEKTPGLIINENVFQKFLETEEIEDLLIKR